ncbi:hypothetical protein GM921_08295 [Pedobacter sp. LMG 31464]|uniref:Lipocalin-like domain-containing protein n=1 Tax=Pedobacter planticolens TaxID=2679964 RepID=A0A923E0T5_9SPHI|nr:hypothetical protein [Pedobacter planticolens]MBB2145479.1 hypothetical protein [Pedobacter planticolens]
MKKLIFISLFAATLLACEKDKNAKDFKGTYSGTFRTMQDGKVAMTDTELTLLNGNFEVKKGIKTGKGSFKLEDKTTVTFSDEIARTADFDWNIILNGSYTYQALGDSLILTRNLPYLPTTITLYQYRLKQVN